MEFSLGFFLSLSSEDNHYADISGVTPNLGILTSYNKSGIILGY